MPPQANHSQAHPLQPTAWVPTPRTLGPRAHDSHSLVDLLSSFLPHNQTPTTPKCRPFAPFAPCSPSHPRVSPFFLPLLLKRIDCFAVVNWYVLSPCVCGHLSSYRDTNEPLEKEKRGTIRCRSLVLPLSPPPPPWKGERLGGLSSSF